MAKPVYFLWVMGMGGWALDPGGVLQINREVHALGSAITVVPPFDPKNVDQVPVYIKTKMPAEALIVYGGDSCGANLFGWVLDKIYPRRIAAAELIQASNYCGNYPIGDNVTSVELFYTDWLVWPLPGLGSFKVQPKLWAPTKPAAVKYPGKYACNINKTTINYIYAPGPHPGDTQSGIQQAIVNSCKRIVVEASAAV